RTDLGVIWIEGHADRTGPSAWNLRLSRRRARAVAEFLVEHAVAPQRLRTAGYGEARPLVPTPAGVANERNRRVQFLPDNGTDAQPAQPQLLSTLTTEGEVLR